MQVHGSDLSSGTTPKVITGEHQSGTDALGKSPVYSPLGSSAHEVGRLFACVIILVYPQSLPNIFPTSS